MPIDAFAFAFWYFLVAHEYNSRWLFRRAAFDAFAIRHYFRWCCRHWCWCRFRDYAMIIADAFRDITMIAFCWLRWFLSFSFFAILLKDYILLCRFLPLSASDYFTRYIDYAITPLCCHYLLIIAWWLMPLYAFFRFFFIFFFFFLMKALSCCVYTFLYTAPEICRLMLLIIDVIFYYAMHWFHLLPRFLSFFLHCYFLFLSLLRLLLRDGFLFFQLSCHYFLFHTRCCDVDAAPFDCFTLQAFFLSIFIWLLIFAMMPCHTLIAWYAICHIFIDIFRHILRHALRELPLLLLRRYLPAAFMLLYADADAALRYARQRAAHAMSPILHAIIIVHFHAAAFYAAASLIMAFHFRLFSRCRYALITWCLLALLSPRWCHAYAADAVDACCWCRFSSALLTLIAFAFLLIIGFRLMPRRADAFFWCSHCAAAVHHHYTMSWLFCCWYAAAAMLLFADITLYFSLRRLSLLSMLIFLPLLITLMFRGWRDNIRATSRFWCRQIDKRYWAPCFARCRAAQRHDARCFTHMRKRCRVLMFAYDALEVRVRLMMAGARGALMASALALSILLLIRAAAVTISTSRNTLFWCHIDATSLW